MGNEDARKLALSTLRFEQQPKPQSEATSKGQRPDLIPQCAATPEGQRPDLTPHLLYFSHGIHRNGA